MRLPTGLVLAAAIWLYAGTVMAQVSGAIVAESVREFSRPHDVVLSPDGAFLYVADVDSDSIKVLDPSTLVTLGAFGADRLAGPHDVAFDRQGRLLVADTHNHRIAIYEVDGVAGAFVDDIRGSLRTPEGVDVASDGTIYVTSASRHNVVKIRNGAIVADVGEGGGNANQYSRPHDIEAASDGRVVVADPGNNRLQVLDADLGFVGAVGAPQFRFDEPKYFTIDAHGWIYVADEYNDRIVILDRDYRAQGVLGAGPSGTESGGLNHPEGAEVAGDRLWIADTGNDRIVLYRLVRE